MTLTSPLVILGKITTQWINLVLLCKLTVSKLHTCTWITSLRTEIWPDLLSCRWQPQTQTVQLCNLSNPGQDTTAKHFSCSRFHGIFNTHIQQVGHWLLKSQPNKSYKVNCMEHNLSTSKWSFLGFEPVPSGKKEASTSNLMCKSFRHSIRFKT